MNLHKLKPPNLQMNLQDWSEKRISQYMQRTNQNQHQVVERFSPYLVKNRAEIARIIDQYVDEPLKSHNHPS